MKRIGKIAAAAAIVAAAGFTAYNAQNKELQTSAITMANIEALARGESDGYCHTNDRLTAICDYYNNGPICPCGF